MFHIMRQFAIYCFGGGLATIVNWTITFALTEFLSTWYVLSYCLGLSSGFLVNFFFQRHITFGVTDATGRRMIRFALIASVTAPLNVALVYALTEYLGMHYALSIVVVTLSVALINYTLNRFWTFHHN